MVIAIIMWFVLSIVVGAVAQSIGRSFGGFLFLSLFLSPLIGFIILGIKGRVTEEEKQSIEKQNQQSKRVRLDREPHIYLCPACGKTYPGVHLAEKNEDFCVQCKQRLIETDFLVDEWKYFSLDERQAKKEDIKAGKHIRGSLSSPSVHQKATPAEEIVQFKNLLDQGIITQEEFDAKKKQLLGM